MMLAKPEFFYDVPQRSDQWRELRKGLITSSDFAALLTNSGPTRQAVIRRVACELVTGEPAESYENDYMRRGRALEREALATFALVNNVQLTPIGFVRLGRIGCSPDSFIGKSRVVEAKTEKAELFIDTLFRNEFPPQHRAQTQGQLWICERDKVDLTIYCRGMPSFSKQEGRNEQYIRRLRDATRRALDEIDVLVRRIKGYGIR